MSAVPRSGLPLQAGSPNPQFTSPHGESGPGVRGTAMLQPALGGEPSPSDIEARVFIQSNFLNRTDGAQSDGAPLQPTERLQAQHHEPPSPAQLPGLAEGEPHHSTRPESPGPHPNNGPPAGAHEAGPDTVQSAPQRENAVASGPRPPRSERTTDADATHGTRGHEDPSAVGRGGYKVNSRGVEAAIGLPMSEGDFWGRVVTAQHALQGHPQCPPGQALGLAIAWAVAASGLEPASATRGPAPKTAGVSASAPGSFAARSSASQAASEAELEEWVGQLHTDLSARASRALIAAWEQRGSALRAVTYERG